MIPTSAPRTERIPIGPLPLADVASALLMSPAAVAAAVRTQHLPYWRDTRRTGSGRQTTRMVLPWETFWSLRRWRWHRLVPRNGAGDPREVFAVPQGFTPSKPAETQENQEETQ